MNQKHVPDLELCQEFNTLCKEKGIVVPKTLFVWSSQENLVTWKGEYRQFFAVDMRKDIPAPLVSEQGEWLWNIFEEHNWDLLYKAYGEVFNFKGTQRIGELGIINLMKRPNMGIKMINYLLAEGIITTL